jgi:osmotically-inducible protein OsmY
VASNRALRTTDRKQEIEMKNKGIAKLFATTFLLAGMALPALASNQTSPRQAQRDKQIEAQVTAQLEKKEVFRSVMAKADDGIVTITGEVPLYIDKVNAEKRVRKVKIVDGVRNHVRVGGPAVSDNDIRENLAAKLRYDRVGYGIVFNNLGVDVNDGVVTISGNVRDFPDRDSALAIASTTAGVKDVLDEIAVAPTSIMDDNLRIRMARAIYGHPSLKQYAIDPQAPIRIIVENGHVELAGMVLNEMDRQLAFVRANSVPGTFSVTNHIAVASELAE